MVGKNEKKETWKHSLKGFVFLYWILCTQKRSHFTRIDWDLLSFIEMATVAEIATKEEVHRRHRIFT